MKRTQKKEFYKKGLNLRKSIKLMVK